MPGELSIDTATGLVVLGWRTAPDGLYFRAKGEGDEVRLRCRCGRCHWIVREHYGAGAWTLRVSCHNCGVHGAFPLEGGTYELLRGQRSA